jgi:indole-3-glycerol phosphate synthase
VLRYDAMPAEEKRPADVLARITAHQRGRLPELKAAQPEDALRRAKGFALPRRSLAAALRGSTPAVIAECKRRSPSRGVLRDPYDPVAIARSYAAAGAAAISVLTNEEFFGGALGDLSNVRDAVPIPVLRKEFVIDPYQLVEARAAGADAVLLIAAILSAGELRELTRQAHALELEVLIEVHDEEEMAAASQAGSSIIGINNRDLRNFVTDLATCERVAPLAPPGTLLVAESGIRDRADVARLQRAGCRAFLVGEAFMTAPDPGAALRVLLGADAEVRA